MRAKVRENMKQIAAALMMGVLLLPLPVKAEEEWQIAYRELLEEYRTSDGYLPETTGEVSFGSRWDLCDVDGNGIPELFISPDTSHAFGCRVYSFVDGETVALETREGQTFGEYGVTKVCEEEQLIRAYHFGMGSEIVGYYHYDGMTLTELDRFVGTSVYLNEEEGTKDTYERNGEEITEQEYLDGIAAYEAYMWKDSVGRAYSFGDLTPIELAATEPPVEYAPEEMPDMTVAWIGGILGAVVLAALAVAGSVALRKKTPKT